MEEIRESSSSAFIGELVHVLIMWLQLAFLTLQMDIYHLYVFVQSLKCLHTSALILEVDLSRLNAPCRPFNP